MDALGYSTIYFFSGFILFVDHTDAHLETVGCLTCGLQQHLPFASEPLRSDFSG